MSVVSRMQPTVYDARNWILDWSGTPASFMTYYQSAVDAVSALGGGTIVFPEAVWKFRHDINYRVSIPSNTTLLMVGGYFDVTGGNFTNSDLSAAGQSGSNYLGVGFVVRSTNDASAKQNIVFDSLRFQGDNDPFIWRGATYYQSAAIDMWLAGTSLNRDIHVRNCSFNNLYGFSTHVIATNDSGSGQGSGYLFTYMNNSHFECGNGANTTWPNSIHTGNSFWKSEGFECSGKFANVSNNYFRETFGAISIGGETTAGRETPGMVVSHNIIDVNHTDQAIVLADGAVGAIISHNIIYKTRRTGILAGTSSTGVAPRNGLIDGNVFISCAMITSAWAATTAYTVGTYVRPTVGTSGDLFIVTVAGTSGGSEPTWPTLDGDTVVNGTVTFMLQGNFGTTSNYGIHVPGDEFTITNNKVYVEADDVAGWGHTYGILVQGDDCVIDGNDCQDASVGDILIDGTSGLTEGQRTRVGPNNRATTFTVERGAVVENAENIGRVRKAYSSGNHTVKIYERDVSMDPSGSARTLTLHTAVGIPGKDYIFRNTGATGTVAIDGSGTETVLGALTRVLQPGEKCHIVSDNANWIAVGEDIRTGSETKDWASIADQDIATEDVTVTGAALGDHAWATMTVDITDLEISAHVSATDTVSVVMTNNTGGAVDLGSATLRAFIRKR